MGIMVLACTALCVIWEDAYSIDARLEKNRGVGVGFGKLSEGDQTLTITLHAPPDGWLIDESEPRDDSGDHGWKPADGITTDSATHVYSVIGVDPNDGHAVGFFGKLKKAVEGDGSRPTFDAAVADLDLDAEGVEDDDEATSPGGGLFVPRSMHKGADFPDTLGEDDQYATLTLSVRPKWAGPPNPEYVGTLTFDVTGDGIQLYDISVNPPKIAERSRSVPAEGLNVQYGVVTNDQATSPGDIAATFTWDSELQGGPATAEDHVRIVPVHVDLIAHRTGDNYGNAVSDEIEDAGDPKKYVVLTNNDWEEYTHEEEPETLYRDFDNEAALIPQSGEGLVDDDLARITLKRMTANAGIVRVVLSNSSAVRVFKDDGSPLSDFTVDLASPSGDLSGLAMTDIDLYIEGLQKDTDFVFAVTYEKPSGTEVCRDDVHILLAEHKLLPPGGGDEIAIVTPFPIFDLWNKANGRPPILDIPETARFKIRVDGVASSDTTITVKALLDSSESYTAELLSSQTQAEARYEGLFYRIDPGRVLASQSKDLIKSQLALDVLGHSNASGKQVGEVTIETTEDRHRRVVTCLAFEFVDHFPDYSNDGDTDCDNFFVRENNDWQGLDIFYNIPEEKLLRPSNVRMDVYKKDTTNLEIQLEGVKDGEDFAKGDGLHKAWNKSDPVPYYRVQLVVAAPLMNGAAKTPIHDARPDWGGWQCPEYGLAVHDLIWKHRPHVHTDGSRSENPTLPANFRNLSGLYLRGTGSTRTRIAGPPVTAAQLMLNNTVEHYLDRDNNDAINHGNPPLPDVTAVIHTANLQDAANHVFVQFWLFYDFSEVATNWAGRQVAGSPYHEGDVEFAQLAVRKQSVPWQSGVPYAVGDVCRASTSLAYRCKQTHTSAPGNAPPNDTYWVRYYNHKALWFQPFSATASQHYYGQTLPWLMHDGSEAALPQTQIHVQHDDENEHFSIFVAEGTHATYFRRGRFNVERADPLRTMGTQVQYTTVGGSDFTFEDAQDSALAIASWIRPDNDVENWMGLWGFKSTVAGAPFGMEDRDGPPGINRRFAVGPPPGLARLLLRPEPRQFNNACRREVGGAPEGRTLIDP